MHPNPRKENSSFCWYSAPKMEKSCNKKSYQFSGWTITSKTKNQRFFKLGSQYFQKFNFCHWRRSVQFPYICTFLNILTLCGTKSSFRTASLWSVPRHQHLTCVKKLAFRLRLFDHISSRGVTVMMVIFHMHSIMTYFRDVLVGIM